MRIDDYNRSGYLENKNNTNIENRGYENLKREGTLKITSVDGKSMNVFYRHGQSSDGNVKIYTDKNNGNITLRGIKHVSYSDIKYFKEDLSKVIERLRATNKNLSQEIGILEEKEYRITLIGEEVQVEDDLYSEKEDLFVEMIFQRDKIESDDKLEEYLELKNLVDKTKIKNTKEIKPREDLRLFNNNLEKSENKLENIEKALNLFEEVKVKIYEDKILISQIQKSSNKDGVYHLLK